MARVGVGKAAVVLDDILPFDGFDEVLDPICARALIIEADTRACIVSLEVTSLRPDLLTQLRTAAAEAAGCTEEQTWVCVTHTFSAPHVRTAAHLANADEVARNARLGTAYAHAVRAAGAQAADTLTEATLELAYGTTSVNVNRDVETPGGWWLGANPEGFSDHSLFALVARRTGDGTAMAVLFSADVQSSILDRSTTTAGLRVVSGDLAGRAAALAEAELPGCVVLFVVGCAADQAPVAQAVTQQVLPDGSIVRRDVHEAIYGMLDELGGRLTGELLAALNTSLPLTCDHISSCAHPLSCPGQQRADFDGLRPRRTYKFPPAAPISTTVSLLRLGELVLVGVEPEISSTLGSRIRRRVEGPMGLLTMVNGAAKYLPDDDAYDKVTYEAMNSTFGRGSDELLAQDVLASIVGAQKG